MVKLTMAGLARGTVLAMALFLLSHKAVSFNLDLEHPLHFTAPVVAGDYFGYSLAVDDDVLYAGAPGFRESGAVFRCPFSFSSGLNFGCQKVENRASSNRDFFGASLAVSESTVFACAPRTDSESYATLASNTGSCYRYQRGFGGNRLDQFYTLRNPRANRATGWTYLTMMGHSLLPSEDGQVVLGTPMARATVFSWADERSPGHIAKVNPLSGLARIPRTSDVLWGDRVHSTEEEPHTYDLTGSALARGRFFYQGEGHYALGAPKANRLRGRVYLCPDCFNAASDLRRRFGSAAVFFEKNSLEVQGEQFGSRFGQAVAAADVNGDGFHDLIVGAPLYSEEGTGGGSDVGRVYVYRIIIRDGSTTLELATKDLPRGEADGGTSSSSSSSGSRFGAALASLNDLDGDGYDDFAVGAPFEGEDGRGAVYVYRGSATFAFNDLPQKITPSGLGTPGGGSGGFNRGFGFSFSSVSDVDGNGRPDLAVGAMDAAAVALIRAREVVRVEPESYKLIPFKAIEPELNEFDITVTAKLKDPVQKNLRVTLKFFNVDERIELPEEFRRNGADDLSSSGVLQAGLKRKIFSLNIRSARGKPNFGMDPTRPEEIPRPLRFFAQVDWELVNERCPRNLGCPMVDPRSKTRETLAFKVPLHSGCQNNNYCECSLEVSDSALAAAEMVVGETRTAKAQLEVKNTGSEPAFDAKMRVASGVDLPPPRGLNCQNQTVDGSTIDESGKVEYVHLCQMSSIGSGKSKTLEVTFDLRRFEPPSSVESDTVRFSVESGCSVLSQGRVNLEAEMRINFVYKSEMMIVPSEKNERRQLGFNQTSVPFTHAYRVTNLGPSPTREEFAYNVFLPRSNLLAVDLAAAAAAAAAAGGGKGSGGCKMMSTGRFRTDLKPPARGGELISCSTHTCVVYECSLPRGFPRGSSATVVAQMTFDASAASSALASSEGPNRYAVRSLARRADSASPSDFAHHTSELYSLETSFAEVASRHKYHIVAGLVGFALAVIVIVALWKSKALSKLSFYSGKIEEAQRESRRE